MPSSTDKQNREVLTCLLPPPGIYRYLLRVQIGAGPTLAVIQKNPSLADAERRDPTVGKVEAWARRQGFGTVNYLNLFAYRSPDPTCLNELAYAVAVGPDNDSTLCQVISANPTLVLGWGNPNGIDPARYRQRIAEVLALLRTHTYRPLYHVGALTRANHPRHGLHWNHDTKVAELQGNRLTKPGSLNC
jgi:hypothetical protein